MNKPFLFLENLLEILPLCLSEDKEIQVLGKELLDTYDCCLFPLTMYLLYDRSSKSPFPILSSKSEEEFLGAIACEAFKPENYFTIGGWTLRESFYHEWWFYPLEMLKGRLELFQLK